MSEVNRVRVRGHKHVYELYSNVSGNRVLAYVTPTQDKFRAGLRDVIHHDKRLSESGAKFARESGINMDLEWKGKIEDLEKYLAVNDFSLKKE